MISFTGNAKLLSYIYIYQWVNHTSGKNVYKYTIKAISIALTKISLKELHSSLSYDSRLSYNLLSDDSHYGKGNWNLISLKP